VLLCLKTETDAAFIPKRRASLKNFIVDKVPHLKKKNCQLTSVVLSSLPWNSWPLKLGPIECFETLVTKYHSSLHNIPQERRSHIKIWWCRPWFGSAWFDSKQSCLARSGSVLHMRM